MDSSHETMEHIRIVELFMTQVIHELIERLATHDRSKLEEPEKPIYDRFTPILRSVSYGSDEYRKRIGEMTEALESHYAKNRHHPEHFEDGISGMSLIDILEMLCDWKAASLRHTDGSIHKSINIGRERFQIGEQLERILLNTAVEMGWD